jgi:hypothetical protein
MYSWSHDKVKHFCHSYLRLMMLKNSWGKFFVTDTLKDVFQGILAFGRPYVCFELIFACPWVKKGSMVNKSKPQTRDPCMHAWQYSRCTREANGIPRYARNEGTTTLRIC